MQPTQKHIDRPFLFVTLLLVLIGFFVFSSASLGLLARENMRFSSVAIPQLVFGVGGGLIVLALTARIPYRRYRSYAPAIFAGALFLTALVFVPHVGYSANGATRWLSFFGISFQPGELLKIAFVLFFAWYLSAYHRRLDDMRYALGGLLAALFLCAIPLFLQPDTGTFAIIVAAGVGMSVAGGVRFLHLGLLVGVLAAGIIALALMRPYLLDRVNTFLHPLNDPRGSGYQIKQSLIAVGSGGMFGRGFGQSVQKFSYLPEPVSDSIFSVAAEEFGFFGSVSLISLFVFFALRGFHIAARAPDRFGGLLVVGIVILILTQTYLNIGSMLGLVPLTGEPLAFMSRGGSSLLLLLASVGIILNVSLHRGRVQTA